MAGHEEPNVPKRSLVVPGRQLADQEDLDESTAFIERHFESGVGFASQISDYRDFSRPYASPPEVFTMGIVTHCLLDVGVTGTVIDGCLALTQTLFTTDGFVHFFRDRGLLDADLDCTAIAHSLCLRLGVRAPSLERALPLLLTNTDETGVMEVYYRPSPSHRGRIDQCVLVNTFYLLHQLGVGAQAGPSWECLTNFLLSDEYLLGTRYYPSPDAFLYFASRLVRDFPGPRDELQDPLRERLAARRGTDTPCFERALRVAACANVGLEAVEDLLVVASARRQDGSWPASSFFRYGKTPRYFGSDTLSTAVGAQALAAAAAQSPEHSRPWQTRFFRNAASG